MERSTRLQNAAVLSSSMAGSPLMLQLLSGRQHRLRKGVMLSSRDPDPSDNPAALGWYLQACSPSQFLKWILMCKPSRNAFFSYLDLSPAMRPWNLLEQVDSRAHGWKDLYFFTETEFTANDFIPLNWYIVSNPHSPFNKVRSLMPHSLYLPSSIVLPII